MATGIAQAELIAVLAAVTDEEPRVMTVAAGQALPSGPFVSSHRSLQAGLRDWIDGRDVEIRDFTALGALQGDSWRDIVARAKVPRLIRTLVGLRAGMCFSCITGPDARSVVKRRLELQRSRTMNFSFG